MSDTPGSDTSEALRALLQNLRGGAPAAPAAETPAPPQKPDAAGPPSPARPAGIDEFLLKRLESLETELRAERAAAAEARARLEAREEARAQAEAEFKRVMETSRQSQSDAQARARVEALEQRLESMQGMWASAMDRMSRSWGTQEREELRDAISRLRGGLEETARGQADVLREFEALRRHMAAMFESLSRPTRAAEEARAELEAMAGALAQAGREALSAFKAELESSTARVREAAEQLGELGERQDLLDQSSKLLLRQQETERRLEQALELLAKKEELLSRVSKALIGRL